MGGKGYKYDGELRGDDEGWRWEECRLLRNRLSVSAAEDDLSKEY